jgi:hypothetical protein
VLLLLLLPPLCKMFLQASVYFCDSSDLSFTQQPKPDAQCRYRISYAEQSSSEGRLVQDVFTFPNSKSSVPVTFGCEASESGEIYKQKPDGILGLGNSKGAFHAQVGYITCYFGTAFCYIRMRGQRIWGNLYAEAGSIVTGVCYFSVQFGSFNLGQKPDGSLGLGGTGDFKAQV